MGDEEHPELLEDPTSITAIAVGESATAFTSADIDIGIWDYGLNLTRKVVMAKLTEEARKAIEGIRPSLVATASETGKSNVSAKGSLRILDDEHVVFADITCPRTFTNIKENPQVAVICPDAAPAAFPNVFGFPRMVAFCILWPTGGLRKMASQLSKLGVSVLRDETGRTLLSALRNSSAGLPESQEAAAT